MNLPKNNSYLMNETSRQLATCLFIYKESCETILFTSSQLLNEPLTEFAACCIMLALLRSHAAVHAFDQLATSRWRFTTSKKRTNSPLLPTRTFPIKVDKIMVVRLHDSLYTDSSQTYYSIYVVFKC